MNGSRKTPTCDDTTEARATRNAWLITALSATLVAALLLYAAHGTMTSLFGIAGLTSLATALPACRRSRRIRADITTGRPPPTSLHTITLVTVLATATTLLALAAVLVNQ